MHPFRTVAILLLLAPVHPSAAHAQDYPTRPIRIVTATPGGLKPVMSAILIFAVAEIYDTSTQTAVEVAHA